MNLDLQGIEEAIKIEKEKMISTRRIKRRCCESRNADDKIKII